MITITENAQKYLYDIAKKNDKKFVSFGVSGGGCAGFKYDWSFDDEPSKDDEKLDFNEFSLLVDKSSLLMLSGMTIEYKKEIFGSFLELKNPNATSSCGCGESLGV